MYVELQNKNEKQNAHFEYHIGEEFPKNVYDIVPFVVSHQADGDELQHIISIWAGNGFPVPDKNVVTWFGDCAKMILANW